MPRMSTSSTSWSRTGSTLNHTGIASFIDPSYYLGEFGISPCTTTFTVTNDNFSAMTRNPVTCYCSSRTRLSRACLGNTRSDHITSPKVAQTPTDCSYPVITILAVYRHSLSMNMGTDQGRELLIGIQGIQFNDTSFSSSLLQMLILATLDSTQPNI
jgi:hypothetical protein